MTLSIKGLLVTLGKLALRNQNRVHYGERHDLFIIILNVVMLSVIMLNVMAPFYKNLHKLERFPENWGIMEFWVISH